MATIAPTSAESAATYPPAPWRLRGQANFHVLVVPAVELPATPDGFTPLVIAGRGLAIVGWLDYQDGSILRYGELLAAIVGRWRGGLSATVTHIWVDSPASRDGGRELWGYPKELAEFELDIDPSGTARACTPDGRELARGAFGAVLTSPWRVRRGGGTVQPMDGRLVSIRSVFGSRPSIGRGRLSAPADSPLSFVNRSRTLVRLGLRDFEFEFGG